MGNFLLSFVLIKMELKKMPEKETKTETEQQMPNSMLEEAQKTADRIEAANKRQEELLHKQEELLAKQVLAGKSEAGQEPEKAKKLSDKEYAEKLERGEVNPLFEDGYI